jgi:ribosomal protein S18 acetylase RimI-like enzyme
MDMAGEGIPSYFWSGDAKQDQTALDVGAKRVSGETDNFSYRNATVSCVGEEILGMLLGYPLPDPYDMGDVASLPAVVRPLIELEALAPGSWYINALAVFPQARGKGVGTALLRKAEDLARQAHCTELSLIVAQENTGAFSLYQRAGYKPVDERPLVGFEGFAHGGNWVLMIKALDN